MPYNLEKIEEETFMFVRDDKGKIFDLRSHVCDLKSWLIYTVFQA